MGDEHGEKASEVVLEIGGECGGGQVIWAEFWLSSQRAVLWFWASSLQANGQDRPTLDLKEYT